MNPRERMRSSNRKVVLYLLDKGYTEIWLKAHGRRHDLVYKDNINIYLNHMKTIDVRLVTLYLQVHLDLIPIARYVRSLI